MKVSDGQDQLAKAVAGSHQKLEATVLGHSCAVDKEVREREDEKRQQSYAAMPL